MSDSLTALDEVRYEPSETFVTESNVYAFMQNTVSRTSKNFTGGQSPISTVNRHPDWTGSGMR